MLELSNVSKSYPSGNATITVLHPLSLQVNAGEFVALVGPSGSGKSTLLGLCAGLDRPTTGTIRTGALVLSELGEDELAGFRNEQVGFVFQSFQLLRTLTALENVMVPAELRGLRDAREQAERLLQRVGLDDRGHHYPSQLSGGEQQRVALARACINRPKLLLADEPTGNLDEESAERVESLLIELHREAGSTLIVATHNTELARRAGRIIRLRAGTVQSDAPTAFAPGAVP